MVGYDTFLLTKDVVSVLKLEGVIDSEPKAKRDIRSVQFAFNEWREQSGRDFCEISRIVSCAAT